MWRPSVTEADKGFSNVLLAEDENGEKWVVRESLDDFFAWQISHKFFEDIVPYTYVDYSERNPRSIQKYIKGKTANKAGFDSLLAVRTPNGLNDLAKIISLDILLLNSDRHSGNWLVLSSGGLAAIDNTIGSSFLTILDALRPAFRTLIVQDSDRFKLLLELIYKKVAKANEDLKSPYITDLLMNIRELEGFSRG